jgi:hypothetical protein
MKTFAIVLGIAALTLASVAAWIWVTTNFDATAGKGWSLMAAARDRDDRFGWRFGAGDQAAEVIADPVKLASTYADLGLGR